MAEFTSSPQVDPSVDPNLYDTVQRNSLANLGLQQGLADRQTFRDSAAGLASGDPTATAAAVGADPTAATNFINVNGVNQRAQATANVGASGSLAAATLNAPPDQRASVYSIGRQALASAGYPAASLPPEDYPGDSAMLQLRAQSLPVESQLKYAPMPLSISPQPLLQSVPGSGSVGPGGVQAGGSSGAITATPLAPPPGDPNAPRGIRNNNPLNLSYVEGQPGVTGSDGRFGQYATPEAGIGSAVNQLQIYQNRAGAPLTPRQIVSQWAPTSDGNNVPAYLSTIQKSTGLDPDKPVDVNDPVQAAKLVSGMGLHENGRSFDPGVVQRGVGMALGQRTQVASAANSTGMAPTANDASPGAPVNALSGMLPTTPSALPAAPSTPTNRLTTAINGLRQQPAAAPDPSQSVAVDNPAAGAGLPAGTPVRMAGGVPPASPQATPAGTPTPPSAAPSFGAPSSSSVGGQPNALAAAIPPAVAATSNSLAGLGGGGPIASTPNVLSGVGAPQTPLGPVQGAPSPAPSPASAPPAGQLQYPFVRDPMTRAYVPVPGQPGFAYAQGPRGLGDLVAQIIPGAPGAGVETHFTPSGDIITSNKSTGQYNVSRGVLPNTSRILPVNDGNSVHLIQPGSGEIGSMAAQPDVPQIQAQLYAEDRKTQAQQVDVAQLAQQQQVKLLEAREALQGLPTGAGGEARTAWSAWAETYLPPAWADQFKAKLGLPNAVPAQEFGKLMTQTAGNQVQGVTGGRAGIGIMSLFKANNPGLQLQPNANRDLLNAQLVATQADADYARQFNGFVNENGQKLINRQGYTPASQFDQQWLAQRNPQVNVAAAEAMSGNPFSFWSKGLSPDEGARAMQIIGRIDPTMTVQGKAGPLPVRQFMGAQ